MGNVGSCSVYLQENDYIEGMGAQSTSPFFSYLGNAAGGRFVLGRPVPYQSNLVQQLLVRAVLACFLPGNREM